MDGGQTCITDPSATEEPKKFSFDYSYWSHDGSKEGPDGYYGADKSHPNGKKFCDQKTVFNDLGVGVLKNAWEGYNSTLFAYGQTGSGKSWSIVGYGVNKGVVPQFCEQMFVGIDEKKAGGDTTEYEVTFSMLEIYNEQVRDLLDTKPKQKGGLKVRQHPKKGFYADGLIVTPVGSYAEIEQKMDEGTMNRTVAATNMNATSSRAHTIVGITFVQKSKNAAGEEMAKTAVINLVDLAGSERADSTGATGDRLKEGAAINQSLSCLGNCIAALADQSSGKRVRVPFRDSVLTKLLKNALGGNSKTIMIAAISPADINYEESLSTLRYADRAKQIKTTATVNEDPTAALIRELQEENERLKKMMESGNMTVIKGDDEDDDDMSEEERASLKEELSQEYESLLAKNQLEMEEMKKNFEEKLAAARTVQESGEPHPSHTEVNEKRNSVAHLYNLNMDPMLTGRIIFFIDTPEKTVGNPKGTGPNDITLVGPSIAERHAIISIDSGGYVIEAGCANVRLLRNGKAVTAKTQLHHNDRLLFGTTQYFVYANPREAQLTSTPFPEVTFEMAQEEIAKKSGFDMSSENKSKEDALLKDDMLELIPAIEEANSISEELDKKMKFELMVVSPEARGEIHGRTEVMVRVVHLETKHEWIWTRQKFLNRKYIMQEMYQNYQEGDEWDLPKEKDPFDEDLSAEFHIGSVKVWLQSLAFSIETKEQLEITDFKGTEVGLLNTEIIPCNKKGKEYTEADDVFVEKPEDQIGKEIHFVVKITSARGLPNRFTDLYAKFLVYTDDKYNETKKIPNTCNPDWNFKKQFDFPNATEKLIEYLKDSAIMIQIWGKQKPPQKKKTVNTKTAMLTEALTKGHVSATNTNTKSHDPDKVKYMMQVALLQKRQQQTEAKLQYFKDLIALLEENDKKRVKSSVLKELYHAKSADEANKCLKLLVKDKGK
ncbi:kinesin-like protein KIF28 isoform X2 [Liolophura sinensis]|uniref:kinesin-like protein KIF28 isoform X2 n=1 Tax=Liolophura sinensis TaxID=3198878 RepID=UPI0031583DD2